MSPITTPLSPFSNIKLHNAGIAIVIAAVVVVFIAIIFFSLTVIITIFNVRNKKGIDVFTTLICGMVIRCCVCCP